VQRPENPGDVDQGGRHVATRQLDPFVDADEPLTSGPADVGEDATGARADRPRHRHPRGQRDLLEGEIGRRGSLDRVRIEPEQLLHRPRAAVRREPPDPAQLTACRDRRDAGRVAQAVGAAGRHAIRRRGRDDGAIDVGIEAWDRHAVSVAAPERTFGLLERSVRSLGSAAST
jgi:hypothetical protein